MQRAQRTEGKARIIQVFSIQFRPPRPLLPSALLCANLLRSFGNQQIIGAPARGNTGGLTVREA